MSENVGGPASTLRALTPPHLAERILSSRSALEGERKDVTILFADIVGSTQLIERLDAEDALERLQPALDAIVAAVHRYEGTITKSTGDGFMALFGAPLAAEDHAVRACLAGLAMQQDVADLGDPSLAIRVGLHSGTVLFHSISSDLSILFEATGEAVHLASRLEQLCEPGQVRCAEATEKLVRGFVGTKALGAVQVKGLSRPVQVFEILPLRSPQTRWQVRAASGLSDFVGRADEFAALKRALDRARNSDGQVLGLVGEAGVGKSRLVHEFLSSIGDRDVYAIEAAALPEGRSVPYLSVTHLMRGWLGTASDSGEAEISRTLGERLDAISPQLRAFTSAFLELLHVEVKDETWLRRDPDERRRIIQRALRAFLLQLTEIRPVVLVFEDLHWLDVETLSVLDGIVEGIGAARLLLIVTYRHEHQERWSSKPYFARYRLDPLNVEETAIFLDACLGGAPELASLKRLIAERGIGMPLFVEELVRSLVESGHIVGSPGQYHAARSIDEIEIPRSVQTIIATRIDRLPPDAKDALQAAAVIGSTVPASLLADTAGVEDEGLANVLTPLQQNGFLFETRIVPESVYTFKHALVRDVALAGISRKRRRNLHLAIVASIERRYHNRLEAYLDQLAYHARQGELWGKAVDYTDQAARRALELSAYGLCARHLNNALQTLQNLPDSPERSRRSIDLRLALRAPLGALGDIEQMRLRLSEASDLARAIANEGRIANVCVSQTFAFNYTGELAAAKTVGVEGLERSRRVNDEELVVAGTYHLAQTYLWAGDYTEAIELLKPVLRLATGPFRESRIGTAGTMSVLTLGMLGAAEAYVGQFTDAERHTEEAIDIADRLARPYDQAIARWYRGFALAQFGAHHRAIPILEDAYKRCQEAEITFLKPVVATSLGFSCASAGRLDEARAVLQSALKQYEETGLRYGIAYASLNLASIALQTGDMEAMKAMLSQTMNLSATCGFAGIEVAAWRLRAMASAAGREPREGAKADGERSLALAQQKKMGPDTAHCHLVLARISGKAGDLQGAKRHAQEALSLYRTMGMTEWFERASKLLGVAPKA